MRRGPGPVLPFGHHTRQLLATAFAPVQQELANVTAQSEQRVERELAVIAAHIDEALSYLRKD